MKTISFQVSTQDRELIQSIAERAAVLARRAGVSATANDFSMDVAAVHANGRPLRLVELAGADDFNFSHDVFGIRRHLDRTTGELRNCFVPRFAA